MTQPSPETARPDAQGASGRVVQVIGRSAFVVFVVEGEVVVVLIVVEVILVAVEIFILVEVVILVLVIVEAEVLVRLFSVPVAPR